MNWSRLFYYIAYSGTISTSSVTFGDSFPQRGKPLGVRCAFKAFPSRGRWPPKGRSDEVFCVTRRTAVLPSSVTFGDSFPRRGKPWGRETCYAPLKPSPSRGRWPPEGRTDEVFCVKHRTAFSPHQSPPVTAPFTQGSLGVAHFERFANLKNSAHIFTVGAVFLYYSSNRRI